MPRNRVESLHQGGIHYAAQCQCHDEDRLLQRNIHRKGRKQPCELVAREHLHHGVRVLRLDVVDQLGRAPKAADTRLPN